MELKRITIFPNKSKKKNIECEEFIYDNKNSMKDLFKNVINKRYINGYEEYDWYILYNFYPLKSESYISYVFAKSYVERLIAKHFSCNVHTLYPDHNDENFALSFSSNKSFYDVYICDNSNNNKMGTLMKSNSRLIARECINIIIDSIKKIYEEALDIASKKLNNNAYFKYRLSYDNHTYAHSIEKHGYILFNKSHKLYIIATEQEEGKHNPYRYVKCLNNYIYINRL